MTGGADTIRGRTLAALVHATGEIGATASLSDIHKAYEREFGAVARRTMSHALASLVTAGEATKYGRIRRMRYAAVAHPVPHRDPSDPLPAVLEVLQELIGEEGRMVTASEVRDRLTSRGILLSSDQVRTRLETLARSSEQKRDRAVGVWADARVERLVLMTSGGQPQVYWKPAGADVGPPGARSKPDLVRDAVRFAVTALGRPATRAEIIRWARTVPEGAAQHAAAEAVQKRGSRTFSAVCSQDSERGGPVVTVRTPLSSRGSYPARFGWGGVSATAAALCHAMDAAALVRPHREASAAEELAGSLFSFSFVSHVITARRAAFHQAVENLLPGAAALDWAALIEAECAAVQVLSEWTLHGPYSKFKKDAYIDALESSLADLATLASRSGIAPSDLQIRHIAGCRGIQLEGLAEVAMEVRDLEGLELNHWRSLFSGVRRVRGALAGGAATDDLDATRSWLDRVDALLHAVRQSHLPRLDALVSGAELVLGSALRDPDLLSDWLIRGVAETPADREAVIVALGLLGEPPPLDLMWPDRTDSHRVAAVIACLALGVEDPGERVARIEAADRAADGAARVITEQALLRAQMGSRLSVLD